MSRTRKINSQMTMIEKPALLRKYNYVENTNCEDERIEDFIEIFNKIELEHINMLIELNNMLDNSEKDKELIDLEQQMKKIQVKKYITVKEFAEIYNISKTSQQNYRGNLKDPLPCHQKVSKGKIVYVVEEVNN